MIETWDTAIDEFNLWRAAERKKGNKIKAADAWSDYWAEQRKKAGLD